MKRKIFSIVFMPLVLCMFSLTVSIYGQKKTATTTTAIKPISTQLKTLMSKRKTLSVFRSGGVSYLGPETGRNYYIINKKTGNAIDYKGMCVGWESVPNQKFSFFRADSGHYYFICIGNLGKALCEQSSRMSYSSLTGRDNEKFIFEEAGDNYYYIKSKQSGNCLYDDSQAQSYAKIGSKQTIDDFKFILVQVD